MCIGVRHCEPKLNHAQLHNDLQKMSKLYTQKMNISPIQNPPFSPNYSGNAASNNIATNVGTVENPGLGSGMLVGEGGGPGTPGQINRPMMIYTAPVIGGGINSFHRSWTGGSLDPRVHDFHARLNLSAHTMRTSRHMEAEKGREIKTPVGKSDIFDMP